MLEIMEAATVFGASSYTKALAKNVGLLLQRESLSFHDLTLASQGPTIQAAGALKDRWGGILL